MAGRIRVFMLQQETEINEVINCEKLLMYPIKKKKESRRINDHEVCKLKQRNAAQLRQLTAAATTTTTTNSVTLN